MNKTLNLELSRILYDMGFNLKCDYIHHLPHPEIAKCNHVAENTWVLIPNSSPFLSGVPAPDYRDVRDWLLEKYNIAIQVALYKNGMVGYSYNYQNGNGDWIGVYPTPTEADIAAIEFILTADDSPLKKTVYDAADLIEVIVYNCGQDYQVWTPRYEMVSDENNIIGIFDVVKIDGGRGDVTDSIGEPNIGDIGYTDGIGWTKIVNKH
jgi:hypothetical protein